MSDVGNVIESQPAAKRPPRRFGPWRVSTWLSWVWWIGIVIFIFHDGVPFWILAIVGVIAGYIALAVVIGIAWRHMSPETQQPFRQLGALTHGAFSPGGTGLGETARRWTVGLFAAGLLFGAADNGLLLSVPAGWPRLAALLGLPFALWVGLIWVWKSWRPDSAAEMRFGRTIAGVVAGVLLVASLLATQATSHSVCTESVRTYDGSECVGDYVQEAGPDGLEVLFLAGLGALAFWISISDGWGKSTA